MIIYLPKVSMNAFRNYFFSDEHIETYTKEMTKEYFESVRIPKFNTRFNIILNDFLKALGI